jgi:hypothetical protein
MRCLAETDHDYCFDILVSYFACSGGTFVRLFFLILCDVSFPGLDHSKFDWKAIDRKQLASSICGVSLVVFMIIVAVYDFKDCTKSACAFRLFVDLFKILAQLIVALLLLRAIGSKLVSHFLEKFAPTRHTKLDASDDDDEILNNVA